MRVNTCPSDFCHCSFPRDGIEFCGISFETRSTRITNQKSFSCTSWNVTLFRFRADYSQWKPVSPVVERRKVKFAKYKTYANKLFNDGCLNRCLKHCHETILLLLYLFPRKIQYYIDIPKLFTTSIEKESRYKRVSVVEASVCWNHR